jgi:hypothetical protein
MPPVAEQQKDRVDEFLEDMAGFVKGAVTKLAAPPEPTVPAPPVADPTPTPAPETKRVSKWFGELNA